MSIHFSGSLEGSTPRPLTPLNRSSDLEDRMHRSLSSFMELSQAPSKIVRYNAFRFDGDPKDFENFFNAHAAPRTSN